MVNTINGFNIFSRTQINYSIGMKDSARVGRVFRRLLLQCIVNGLIMTPLTFLVFWVTLNFKMVEDEQVAQYIS